MDATLHAPSHSHLRASQRHSTALPTYYTLQLYSVLGRTRLYPDPCSDREIVFPAYSSQTCLAGFSISYHVNLGPFARSKLLPPAPLRPRPHHARTEHSFAALDHKCTPPSARAHPHSLPSHACPRRPAALALPDPSQNRLSRVPPVSCTLHPQTRHLTHHSSVLVSTLVLALTPHLR